MTTNCAIIHDNENNDRIYIVSVSVETTHALSLQYALFKPYLFIRETNISLAPARLYRVAAREVV